METLQHGPFIEQTMITAGLDYYKPTMSQLAHEIEPDTIVTFTLKNRGEQRLADYVTPQELTEHFAWRRDNGFSEDELSYLAGLRNPDDKPVFEATYIDYIRQNALPPVEVSIHPDTNDIHVESTGPWALVSLWETVVMADLNDIYFSKYVQKHGLDIADLYAEGDRRLSEKIAQLQQHPHIKISDFGTRRHFSGRWQKHVVERLQAECPDNLIGTSNVALSKTLDLRPIGTFAHEMPMVYAGLADARGQDMRTSHEVFLEDWYKKYGKHLSIALTDTFTTDFFFDTFTKEQAENWRGVRHDSGDPVAFTERLRAFYTANGIDPKTKEIVYSDGLDMATILDLDAAYGGLMKVLNGWGTTLTNDLGVPSLNIVMKATRVQLPTGESAELVKLSDNVGKHTGSLGKVALYEALFTKQLVQGAA